MADRVLAYMISEADAVTVALDWIAPSLSSVLSMTIDTLSEILHLSCERQHPRFWQASGDFMIQYSTLVSRHTLKFLH